MKSSWAAHASPDLRGPLNISPHFLPITYEHFRYADNPPHRLIYQILYMLLSTEEANGDGVLIRASSSTMGVGLVEGSPEGSGLLKAFAGTAHSLLCLDTSMFTLCLSYPRVLPNSGSAFLDLTSTTSS